MLPRRDLLTFFFPTDLTFVIQMFEFLNTVVFRYTFIPLSIVLAITENVSVRIF